MCVCVLLTHSQVPLDAAMDEVEPEPEVRSDDEPDGADTTFKME